MDQDVDEPWPVEVYSHDGQAHNVTMMPGDMVLYESHTVLHGRPHPLKGRFYANVFVHFIPVDHDANNEELVKTKLKNLKLGGHEHEQHDAATLERHAALHDKEQTEKAVKDLLKLQEKWKKDTNEDAEEEQEELREAEAEGLEEEEEGEGKVEVDLGEEDAEDVEADEEEEPDGRTEIHRAAAEGDLEGLEKLLSTPGNSDMLHARDVYDWQAVHEAARAGQLEALKYLINMGADCGAKTDNGGTALWWARKSLPADHEVIAYLESISAVRSYRPCSLPRAFTRTPR